MNSKNPNLNKYLLKYNKNNTPIEIDIKKVLNPHLCEKKIDRQAHYIHYYPGRLHPFIPHYLLSLDEIQSYSGYLLDPFAGSGTVLVESLLHPTHKMDSLGVDINPLARLICKVKLTPLNLFKLNEAIIQIENLFNKLSSKEISVPDFTNIDLWYSNNSKIRLAKLRTAINNVELDTDSKDFFWLVFSTLSRRLSNADPFIPPPVKLDISKYSSSPDKAKKVEYILSRSSNPDILNEFKECAKVIIAKLSSINNNIFTQPDLVSSKIIWDDARSIRKGHLLEKGHLKKSYARSLPSNSVDVILTSPPYLTAQKYIRSSKLELFWLDYNENSVRNADKESIGTEITSNFSEFSEFDVNSIDNLVDAVFTKSKERGITVFDYFNKMNDFLKEMYRVAKPDSYAFLVLGDNYVLRKKINTYKLISNLAENIGFTEKLILKDEIKCHSFMTSRNESAGIIKHEYIVILKKGE